jgi:hypothetical protein
MADVSAVRSQSLLNLAISRASSENDITTVSRLLKWPHSDPTKALLHLFSTLSSNPALFKQLVKLVIDAGANPNQCLLHCLGGAWLPGFLDRGQLATWETLRFKCAEILIEAGATDYTARNQLLRGSPESIPYLFCFDLDDYRDQSRKKDLHTDAKPEARTEVDLCFELASHYLEASNSEIANLYLQMVETLSPSEDTDEKESHIVVLDLSANSAIPMAEAVASNA